MKRLLCHALRLLLLLFPVLATAATWTPDNLRMVHLDDKTRYVCDPDGYLQASTLAQADRLLALWEEQKGVESVVVIAEHLEGDDPYTFGMELARKYGIGNKQQSSGFILLISPGDRSYRILTGNGLEGTLTDALCRRVENRYMVPALKKGDWDTALLSTLQALNDPILYDKGLSASPDEEDADLLLIRRVLIVMALGFLIFFIVYIYLSTFRRCPQCGKRKMTCVVDEHIIVDKKHYRRKVWHCAACDHQQEEEKEDEEENNNDNHGSPLYVPPLYPGGGGFRHTGFGNGGGSFGGGSFGGGGSGGRF